MSLWESEDFKGLIETLSEPEIVRERKQIAIHLNNGDMAKACIAQGALQVWESGIADAFKREHSRIQRRQKGTDRPRG